MVTFKLPETVRLGRHELVVVVEEESSRANVNSNVQALMQFAGSVAAFKQTDGLEYQKAMRV
jgi:hypothetical protein